MIFRKIPVQTGVTRGGYTEILDVNVTEILLEGASPEDRAKLLEDAERFGDAAESYKKAGKTLKLMNKVVTCYIKAEQTDKAVEQLKEIEKTFKKEAVGAAYRIACLYRDAEDTEKQKAALRHVVKNYQGTAEAKKAGKELAELEPLEIPDGPVIEL